MRPPRGISRCAKAFTLVELMVVMFIMAVLMTVLLGAVGTVMARAKRTMCQANLKSIYQALKTYETSSGGYWPGEGECTDGKYFRRADPVNKATPGYEGFSWQHILDKVMGADIAEGKLYSNIPLRPLYRVNNAVVNRRGAQQAFTDPVAGTGAGVYIGSSAVFLGRLFPSGASSQGPLNMNTLVIEKGSLSITPVAADGSRANTDEIWACRLKTPAANIQYKPHVKVVGTFAYKPATPDPCGPGPFSNIEFRHLGRANILFMDGQVKDMDRVQASKFAPNWDAMFPP